MKNALLKWLLERLLTAMGPAQIRQLLDWVLDQGEDWAASTDNDVDDQILAAIRAAVGIPDDDA